MDIKKVRTLQVQNPPARKQLMSDYEIVQSPTGQQFLEARPIPPTPERTRKLSDREKINAALGDTVVDRYIQQEAKRATRQQIDQPATLKILIALTVLSFVSSAVLVAEGTALVAQYMIFPKGFESFGYLVFGSVEVAILALMLLYLLVGSRPDELDPSKPAPANRWFVAMGVFVGITVLCQVFKTLDGWEYAWTEPKMWVGIVLSTIVPLSYVLISKGLSTAVFARAIFISPKQRKATK